MERGNEDETSEKRSMGLFCKQSFALDRRDYQMQPVTIGFNGLL